MSAAELERADVVEAEEQTRKEQMKTFEARLGALNLRQSFSSRLRRGQQRGGNHNADGQSTDGISDESIVNHADGKETAAARSGGFLPVHLPLTEAAKASLQAFFDGVKRPALAPTAAGNGDGDVRQLNKLLEMAIVVDGTHVEVLVTKSVMIHDEESKHKLFPVNHDECRFYLYAFDSGKIGMSCKCCALVRGRDMSHLSIMASSLYRSVRIVIGRHIAIGCHHSLHILVPSQHATARAHAILCRTCRLG